MARLEYAISNLRQQPRFKALVADRVWQAWWKDKDVPLSYIEGRVQENFDSAGVPFALVAHQAATFVGTASVIACDMEERPQYSPWVAAVWVDPEYRGIGIGSSLVKAASNAALKLGYSPVYLCASPIGIVGCGRQARSHVEAFRAEFPIRRVVALGRSRQGTGAFVDWVRMQGLTAEACSDPAALLGRSDVVVTTVPAASSLRPFLDARAMKPSSFASLVDLGRSWMTETLGAFDPVYTQTMQLNRRCWLPHAAFFR